MPAAIGYRRDIDGLRALAIVPVVLSHTGVPGFSGGFIGVDIFFVISGFLITGIIAREFDDGKFSLVQFYERRARRILPALLVMICFVLAGATWLYLPDDFESVPQSTLMTLAFLANVWFSQKVGYFAPDTETMPLLHCWSLAVEEQFYIAMPLLLWLIARFSPRRRSAMFWAIALTSFGLAWWRQNNFGGTWYYLPIGRAWELLAGALLAVGAIPPVLNRWLREGLSLTGLGLIGYAISSIDSSTPFPGVATLAPVLGTALLIHSAPGTFVGQMLSMRLPVGIGLISYSLYLWHWPLIAFAEYYRDGPLTGNARFVVVTIALIAAWASWRFVERPFRNQVRMPRRRIFIWSGAGLVTVSLIAAAMIPLGGWPTRFSPQVIRIAASGSQKAAKLIPCNPAANDDVPGGCQYGASTVPSIFVWSDSHGLVLGQALGEELRPQGQALIVHSYGGCPPLVNLASIKPKATRECISNNAEILRYLEKTPEIKQVFISGNWSWRGYHQADTISNFDATVARIRAAGKGVVIVGPVPIQPFNVPRRLAHLAKHGELDQARGATAADYARQTTWFTSNYARWQADGITILDPARGLAPMGQTLIIEDGASLYIDDNHLSLAGARLLLSADPRR